MDIAEICGITKGTVLYHFGSKDELFYEIIHDYVSGELERLIAELEGMPADKAMHYILTILFTKRKSVELQRLIADEELFAKSHEVMDEVRREIIYPVLQGLVAQGNAEGLFDIVEPEIGFSILGYGFEGFIHNNFRKFKDKEFYRRFLRIAEQICEATLRPTRIKFTFEQGIDDEQ